MLPYSKEVELIYILTMNETTSIEILSINDTNLLKNPDQKSATVFKTHIYVYP